jgi:hypothetical protein
MAKIKQGIFGPIVGTLGSLVGSSWMGIAYLKNRPRVNKNAVRSPAQVANNLKFAYVNEWLIPFHAYIIIGFQSMALRKTALAAALSAVYNPMFLGIMPDATIDYAKMQISGGTLNGLRDVSITCEGGNHIYLTWHHVPMFGTSYNDQVMLALYCEELHMVDGFTGNVSRTNEKHDFLLQEEMVGKPLHVYVAVVSFNRKKSSQTIYLGLINTI